MTSRNSLPRLAFTPAQAARVGVSSSSLHRMAATGKLERIAPGLYQRPDTATYDLDLYAAAVRAPRATICLTSALARHGLVDAIPATTDLALPRGTRKPALKGAAITWHLFDAATFNLGRTTVAIPGAGRKVGLYSPERSIVDAFRLRSIEGYEIATEALRTWLGRRGSNPADLLAIATQLPRAEGPIRRALEYLA